MNTQTEQWEPCTFALLEVDVDHALPPANVTYTCRNTQSYPPKRWRNADKICGHTFSLVQRYGAYVRAMHWQRHLHTIPCTVEIVHPRVQEWGPRIQGIVMHFRVMNSGTKPSWEIYIFSYWFVLNPYWRPCLCSNALNAVHIASSIGPWEHCWNKTQAFSTLTRTYQWWARSF